MVTKFKVHSGSQGAVGISIIIALSNATQAEKDAAEESGGVVCSGANDQVDWLTVDG